MPSLDSTHPISRVNETTALHALLAVTQAETGQPFFEALVRGLAQSLGTCGAWVTEYDAAQRRLRALSFWFEGDWIHDYAYPIDGTPCAPVIDERRMHHVPDRIVELYPGDNDLERLGAVSYLGVPLLALEGRVLGHLAVLDNRPLPREPKCEALLNLFATRAAAELRRLAAEADLREREEELAHLFAGAMDALIEHDAELRILRANPSADRIFGVGEGSLCGQRLTAFLEPAARERLTEVICQLSSNPEGSTHNSDSNQVKPKGLWISGGLQARRMAGDNFAAEATLSRIHHRGRPRFLLVLRDVQERLTAERRIATLEREATWLREELAREHPSSEILGQSPGIVALRQAIAQVAPTPSTVLILGETGTGKELVARAVHAASQRAERPLIKLNCAALQPTLIESELFGHERGAFTGATTRREGRFLLADGGTLFLDEIGELPLDLQPKLLRVLQEGEFEPVGSSRTIKVDVRVIAATNRDLQQEVAAGRFRADLFYRLNVFPLRIPPLRERREDVPLLARAFLDYYATLVGRRVAQPDPAEWQALSLHAWPGNIRELQNVVERAVICAQTEKVRFDVGLPVNPAGAAITPEDQTPIEPQPSRILTMSELRELERENLRRALQKSKGRISGPNGAARLIGVPPTTLSSRIKKLDVNATIENVNGG